MPPAQARPSGQGRLIECQVGRLEIPPRGEAVTISVVAHVREGPDGPELRVFLTERHVTDAEAPAFPLTVA